MEIDSVSAIKEIVANGLAVSIISHNVCREEEKSGKLAVVPIENSRMVRQLSLVFPPDFQHPELLREFAERIRPPHWLKKRRRRLRSSAAAYFFCRSAIISQ